MADNYGSVSDSIVVLVIVPDYICWLCSIVWTVLFSSYTYFLCACCSSFFVCKYKAWYRCDGGAKFCRWHYPEVSRKSYDCVHDYLAQKNTFVFLLMYPLECTLFISRSIFSMGLLPDTQNCGCACAGNAGNVFPVTAGKRSRHASRHVRHARAVMHVGIVNWRFPLRSAAGENVPGIPGACATCNLTYLVRGPCNNMTYITL